MITAAATSRGIRLGDEDIAEALDFLRATIDVVPGLAADAGGVEVCTGAIREVPDDVFPVLCSTPALAAVIWRETVEKVARGKKVQFIKMPTMAKLMMTVTDRRQMQRLVSDRYAVTCRLKVV